MQPTKRIEIRLHDDPSLVEGVAATLRARDPFSALEPAVVASFVRAGAVLDLAPGEALIRENEPAAAEIYLLIAGALGVQSQGRRIARLDRPGDIVGEVAVLLSSKRTADVMAEGPTRVMAVPSKVLAMPEFAEVAAGMRRLMLRDDWVQY